MSKASETDFGREAFKGFSAKVLLYVFGLVATAYFARELGPETFGGYFLLLSIVAFVNRVPHGIGGACQKRISEVDTPDDELLGVVVVTAAAVGVVGTILAYAFRGPLVGATGLDSAPVLAPLLLVTMSLYVPLLFLLCGQGRFGDKDWVELLRDVLKHPVQLAFVVVGLGAMGMAFGRIAATVVCLPAIFFLLAVRPAIPSRKTLDSVWAFARPNVASNLVGKAYTRFDVFVLGFVGATAAVGFYEIALLLTQLSVLVSNVVMDGLFSKVSALDSEGRSVESSVVTTLSYTGVLAVPVFVVVAVLGKPLLQTTYGAEYVAALPFLVALGFYRIVQVQREALDSTLKGLDRPDLVFRTTGAAVAVNFLVGVPLLLVHGPMGVVVATVLAELTQWRLLHRALADLGHDVPMVPRPLQKQGMGALVMGVVLVGGTTILSGPYAPSTLTALISVGAVTYVGTVVITDETVARILRTILGDLRTHLGDRAPT